MPIECELLVDGMQSTVLVGAGHGAGPMLPSRTVSGLPGETTVSSGLTVIRVSRAVFSASQLTGSAS